MEIALVSVDTHTHLSGEAVRPHESKHSLPAHHTKARQEHVWELPAFSLPSGTFLFSKQWICAFPSRKVLPKCKREWVLQRDVAPEVQTYQGHLQSCGKGSEKSDYCKGWFQLHLTAGPVFICAGWQGKGEPFLCWLPTKAE